MVMVSMCVLMALLVDYYGKTMLWSCCLCVYWGLYYWIIMGRLCCSHGVYVSTGGSSTGLLLEDYVVVMLSMCLLGLYYWIIMGRLCCGHGVYVSTGLLWEDCVVGVSTVGSSTGLLWEDMCCGHGVYVSTGGSSTGLLWEDCVVSWCVSTVGSSTGLLWEDCVMVMLSMCLLGALLLDYYGKTVLWSWCLCVGALLLTVLWSWCLLLWVLLLDYYGKTVLWSCCLCVYWGLYYWIIMGRLYCGHGVYVSTGGSTTVLLWEDCVVVIVFMCLLGALLLDYYGKTMFWSWCLCLLGALLLDYYGKTMLWSWCLCVY